MDGQKGRRGGGLTSVAHQKRITTLVNLIKVRYRERAEVVKGAIASRACMILKKSQGNRGKKFITSLPLRINLSKREETGDPEEGYQISYGYYKLAVDSLQEAEAGRGLRSLNW